MKLLTESSVEYGEVERGRRRERKPSTNARAKVAAVGRVFDPAKITPAPHRIPSFSCPPSFFRFRYPRISFLPGKSLSSWDLQRALYNFMLSAPTVDLTFDDDDWSPPTAARLYRAASVGNSWGVTSMGRGFDWNKQSEDNYTLHPVHEPIIATDVEEPFLRKFHSSGIMFPPKLMKDIPPNLSPSPKSIYAPKLSSEPQVISPGESRSSSPSFTSSGPPSSRSPRINPSRSTSATSACSRRRSSQQRVSLIAGRVSIAPMEPSSPQLLPHLGLNRSSSQCSFISAVTAGPPTPYSERESYLGGKSIQDFVVEDEIGRGAYGLVKRVREIQTDGSLGPPLVIKYIIKSRILADCWKKHPQHGTIPIEIFVMSAISKMTYTLPARRPWDPSRLNSHSGEAGATDPHTPHDSWEEGKSVQGHPGICPLIDFFEDNHYYYLVMPSLTPERIPDQPRTPSDLFDLVEIYPHGLPPSSIRSYLGQLADALFFLHSHGIVHRDVKDENVILSENGRCILIDFGSSGLVKKKGWDTFSGTLDYAAPEILRGERYLGKEQDVWAFGVVAYVLLVGECPFVTAAEAQEGLTSPFANATIALDERCGEGKNQDGLEPDGGGALEDAAALVRACLHVDVNARPTFERILQSRFLSGRGGWSSGEA